MGECQKKGKGNEWRVPFFNMKSAKNAYYANGKRLGHWYIKDVATENPSISSLPCLDMKAKRNSRQYKYYPTINRDEVSYIKDTTYIFKNSSSKKLHLGYAIFKLDTNTGKWNRVSNIAKIDLYAYEISKNNFNQEVKKYFINII